MVNAYGNYYARLRLYYLRREFSHIVVHTVNVPHRNLAKAAMSELHDVIDGFESSAPDALTIINGYLDNCNLRKISTCLCQHICCPTGGAATLDLFHTNVQDAYKSIWLLKLGKTDHYLSNPVPQYAPIVQLKTPIIITMQQWD